MKVIITGANAMIACALSVGGDVTMANHDSFTGAYFGMLTDKFGID